MTKPSTVRSRKTERLGEVLRRVAARLATQRILEKVAAPDLVSVESGAGSATREETPSMKVAVDGVATARGVSGEDQAAAMRRGNAAQFVDKGGPATSQQLAHHDRRVVMSPLSPASNRPSGYGATTRTLELQPVVVRNDPDPIGRCSSLHGSWYACPFCIREIQTAAPRCAGDVPISPCLGTSPFLMGMA